MSKDTTESDAEVRLVLEAVAAEQKRRKEAEERARARRESVVRIAELADLHARTLYEAALAPAMPADPTPSAPADNGGSWSGGGADFSGGGSSGEW